MVGNPHLGICKTEIAQGYFRPLRAEGEGSATNPMKSHPGAWAWPPSLHPAALQHSRQPPQQAAAEPAMQQSQLRECPKSFSLRPPGLYIHIWTRKGSWHWVGACLAIGFSYLTMQYFSLAIRIVFFFFSSVVFVYTWIFKISNLGSYIG